MALETGSIRFEEEFILNSRGFKLYTCRWLPGNTEPKALIFLCHGYAMECSISMKGTGIRLAMEGFAVYGIDYEGHGKSDGLEAYIPFFDDLVNDCSSYFTSISEKTENKRKLRFLLGESMGGAVALLLHQNKPDYWDGAVLVAPMCKIADDMKPHPLVLSGLAKLSKIIPKWKIIPTKDIIDLAIKEQERRDEVRSNPLCYKGKPRLKTGSELLRVSLELEKNLYQVSLPFLIVHGGDDKVTDPSISKLLYESAASEDKSFKLYPGMCHALTSGEPVDNINLVFTDIIDWLDHRTTPGTTTSKWETEQKAQFDDPHIHALQGKKMLVDP
ncbi:caffeoylshikimate esterase-like [Telopea speciosissima]|uniref:caffeoylshikimate esterase-like n=1 Tax=Telopea speciosissima TaxID=54955 RepID=UPI001CC4A06A|nr:caffeoylshikimate esterase-like [Telopea speciosissima]